MNHFSGLKGVVNASESCGTVSTPKAPDVTVITISTNEGDELDRCLASVLKNRINLEYIVFNNASTDHTHALLNGKYRDERIIAVNNISKKGFIENNNHGIRMARGRYILLLNPDTIIQPDTLEIMVSFMDEHPDAAVSTCRLTYADGSIQLHVRRFPTPWVYFLRISMLDKVFTGLSSIRRYVMSDLDPTRTQQADWFITAFFFMRASIIEEVGALDERLLQPFYCEDVEWCFRVRLMGYKNYYVADTSIIHDYQQGSRKKIGKLTLIHLCNIFHFFRKHGYSMLTGKVKSI